jgi:hypothetical protein
MQIRFFPESPKGFAQSQEIGLHEYVLDKVPKNLNKGKDVSDKTAIPTHVDLLVAKYREGTARDCIPSTKYIASDCLDHLFAGR